jgi:hypothetical protein
MIGGREWTSQFKQGMERAGKGKESKGREREPERARECNGTVAQQKRRGMKKLKNGRRNEDESD